MYEFVKNQFSSYLKIEKSELNLFYILIAGKFILILGGCAGVAGWFFAYPIVGIFLIVGCNKNYDTIY